MRPVMTGMLYKGLLIALALSSSTSLLAKANPPREAAVTFGIEMQRFRQRAVFLEARQIARKGKLSALKPLLESLTDYPLRSYIEYEALLARPYSSDEAVQAFIENHPNFPISAQLRRAFADYRRDQDRSESFLSFHQPEDADVENQCFRASALWALERTQAAMAATRALWLHGRSQPKRCDKAFSRWRRAGGLTQALAWQRYELAVLAGEDRLAAYLERTLSEDQRTLARQLTRLRQRPTRTDRYETVDFNDPEQQALADSALKMLIKKRPAEALHLIADLKDSGRLAPAQALEYDYAAALRLIREDNLTVNDALIPAALRTNPDLIEASLIQLIKAGRFNALSTPLSQLPASAQGTLRWQYWQARAELSSPGIGGRESARVSFERLASERDYYGHLAALWLGIPGSLADQSTTIAPEKLLDLAAAPTAPRIYELRALGETLEARREWFQLIKPFSNTELRIAAALASQWHWHDMAIATLAQAQAWDEVLERFPRPYAERFTEAARTQGVPVTLAMAVARRESGFWTEARSPVGAQGLMQLMPRTAQSVAKSIDLDSPTNLVLTQADTNIKLGTAYLGQLLQRFNDNRVLALAAYNAGPSRAKKWYTNPQPIDAFIEGIPFAETRAYVKAVLLYAAIYAQLNGLPEPLLYPYEIEQFSPNDPLPIGPSVFNAAAGSASFTLSAAPRPEGKP
ncbi:MAG: transglycosylase SLT domain-containing protein [Gammaproteobacteria bacterium]|nr:transglycosylase SLT domain-containing protein [Gammaproteobacteria bacterium]